MKRIYVVDQFNSNHKVKYQEKLLVVEEIHFSTKKKFNLSSS